MPAGSFLQIAIRGRRTVAEIARNAEMLGVLSHESAGTIAVFVTMLRLDRAQRTALSETLRELANVVAGILVLGQFIGEQPLSPWLILVGMAGWVVLSGLGVILAGDNSNESHG